MGAARLARTVAQILVRLSIGRSLATKVLVQACWQVSDALACGPDRDARAKAWPVPLQVALLAIECSYPPRKFQAAVAQSGPVRSSQEA